MSRAAGKVDKLVGAEANPGGYKLLTRPVPLNVDKTRMGWMSQTKDGPKLFITGSPAKQQCSRPLLETKGTEEQNLINKVQAKSSNSSKVPVRDPAQTKAVADLAKKKAEIEKLIEKEKPDGSSTGGMCFAAGTRIWRNGPIEDVRVGDRVATWLPGEAGFDGAAARADANFDPADWRMVRLAQELDGHRIEADLLRPRSWLFERGAAQIGDRLDLDLPEMGAIGEFRVQEIRETVKSGEGQGRIITGVLRHSKAVVYDLWVEGESDPLGITALHPMWSADRNDWVAAENLLIGERVCVEGGTKRVFDFVRRGEEPVFNLEVDADHCYRVGDQGILVHNASSPNPPLDVTFLADKNSTGSLYDLYPKPSAIMRSTTPHLQYGERNLGALTYSLVVNGKTVAAGRLPATGFQQNDPGKGKKGHSERILLDQLEELAQQKSACAVVLEIYTERTPCDSGKTNCDTVLSDKAKSQDHQIKVYSIALAGMLGRENPQDILDAYMRLMLYNSQAKSWTV